MKNAGDKRIALVAAVIVIVVLACVLLTACDNAESSGDFEYGMYVRRTLYDKDEGVMTVYVSLTNDDSLKIEGANANWHYQKFELNAFFGRYDYTVNFSPSTIFCAVENSLTQEQRIVDGVEYNVLKVVFEYATIYKSLKSEGEVSKLSGYYLHDFALDESETSFDTTLCLRTQRSAAWYGVLIAVAVAIFGVVIAIMIVRRKKYAKQERTENN